MTGADGDQFYVWLLSDHPQARAERDRREHETYMRVSGPVGSWDYRYPAHLTGPGAASYPSPPEPEAEGVEPGG